jgi:6-phosphogluconolactonase
MHRPTLFCLALIAAAATGPAPFVHAAEPDANPAPAVRPVEPDDTLVYVGTYTGEKAKGIYLFRLVLEGQAPVPQNLTLEPLGVAAELSNPSFLEIDPKRRLLFTVNEMNESNNQPGGGVSSFSIDAAGKLTPINQQSTKGRGPCHLTLDKTGKFLLVANYSGGSVTVVPVAADGKLGEASDFHQHKGSSVNKARQEGPHAHCVTMDPTNRFALVCDLGLDQVLVYKFDADQGKLTPNNPPHAALKPGAGPRHLAFHPNGKFAYVINELDSTITTFAFDSEKGSLTAVETVPTLPLYYDGENTTAEIHVHPSGKYLYGSNRGHESVVLFEIDEDTGKLRFIEEQGTGGKTPRHFELDRRGAHLIIANQNTHTLLVCRVDAENGRLKPSGVFVDCPSPACVKFLEPARGER